MILHKKQAVNQKGSKNRKMCTKNKQGTCNREPKWTKWTVLNGREWQRGDKKHLLNIILKGETPLGQIVHGGSHKQPSIPSMDK